MQYRITQPSRLLDKKGELIQKGYATSLILKYRKKDVARKMRLKQWDYYLIYNDDYGIALVVGDSALVGIISATFIDFKNKTQKSKTIITVFPEKKYNMPESSEVGNIEYQNKNVKVSFKHDNDNRILYLEMKNFDSKSDLQVSIILSDEPKESMVIATPFLQSKKDFYYNQKIIGMKATGTVTFSDMIYPFNPETSFGLLDWGRGVWPYKTTWYWSAAQGMIEDKVFGFNLGYGFGDTSAATENMLFYNGIASKLKDVVFIIPKNEKNEYDYMKNWIITDFKQQIEMIFVPIIDRSVVLSALVLSTNQHQVFGKFTGKAKLDDGTVIRLNNFMGFAERVENKW